MSLHTSADALITCTYWDEVVAEDGFLGLGRNRYHCSYMVYADGTHYYAENGTTGTLDYGGPNNRGGISGIDAAAVVQATHDAMATGGTIFLKGYFPVNISINITNSIKFSGIDWAIPGVTGAGTTTFGRTTDNPIFIITADYVSFEDLSFWGNALHITPLISVVGAPQNPVFKRIWLQRNGGRGIDLGDAYWCVLEKIRATNLGDYPIYSSGGPGIIIRGLSAFMCKGLIYINGGRAHIVEDVEADAFVAGADLISFSNAGFSLRAVNLEGNALTAFQSRVIDVGNSTFSMDNIRLWYLGGNAPNVAPIYIHDASHGRISSLITTNTYSTYSVEFGAANIFIEFKPDANNLDVPANGLYENQGTAIILNGGNSIVVAHGLRMIPTNIVVTGTTTDVTDLYVHTIGAANFTIQKTAGVTGGNRDVFWRASV